MRLALFIAFVACISACENAGAPAQVAPAELCEHLSASGCPQGDGENCVENSSPTQQRSAVVPKPMQPTPVCAEETAPTARAVSPYRLDWASALKRVFGTEILLCPCRRKVIAFIETKSAIKAILEHLGLPWVPLPIGKPRGLGKQVFVDHTFLFTGAVQELKRLVTHGSVGKLLYVDSVRINLGLFQQDVDVIWDLAPHDLSILHHVIGRAPKTVAAMGSVHNPSGFADVAYLHLDYGDELTAHLHLSWLSPVKVRRMIFAGTQQSVIYDDLEPAEKIKIYDHGVDFDVKDAEARRRVLVSYRKGDMRAPNIAVTEALALELTNVAAVLRGSEPARAPGSDGAAVVRVLEAAQRSLKNNGAKVEVESS